MTEAGSLSCPHCSMPVAPPDATAYPPRPMRCPHCRLIIGAGRASRPSSSRAVAASAGVLANAARTAGATALPTSLIDRALQTVAMNVGGPVSRLRMLDYDAAHDADPELPSLASVLATHGDWKTARRAAESDAGTSPA